VLFRKQTESGFDIKVSFDAPSQMISLETDRGYHDHFHTEKFENRAAAFSCVFGIVRDLLTQHMRIEEIQSNGRPRKWLLQAFRDGRWATESSTGLLFWNVFGRRTHVYYQNDALPPRAIGGPDV